MQPAGRHPLDARRCPQRLDLETQVPVDLVLAGALLLHLLEPVAVRQQLEVLPRREQQHRDEEDADAHRAPHLAMALAIDLPDDRVVADVFLDRVFECFGRHVARLSRRPLGRPQLRAPRARVPFDLGLRRHDRPLGPDRDRARRLQRAQRVLHDAILERVKRDHHQPPARREPRDRA